MIHETHIIRAGEGSASLLTYLLDNSPEIDPDRERPLVMICPGGAYRTTSDREAEPVAVRMNAMGIHACVLRYSVAPARFPTALLQLAGAVALARRSAAAWHVDARRIVVLGFSAGGHLAASLGAFWDQGWLRDAADGDCRPDGLVLCYPVITAGEFTHALSLANLMGEDRAESEEMGRVSLENQVGSGMPPCFLWHTYEDDVVPLENSLLFAQALRTRGVPFELHIYPHGGHGLSLADEETAKSPADYGIQPECQNWISMAGRWIRGL